MPETSPFHESIEYSLQWLQRMLVVPDGSMGVYERYRIDLQQVNHWIRPDCTMDVARLFMAYGQYQADNKLMEIGNRLAQYVVTLQRADGWLSGSFPFYQFAPAVSTEEDIGDGAGGATFPNDNGRIAERLIWFYRQTHDETYFNAAKQALDFLVRIQATDGTFSKTEEAGEQDSLKGPVFVAWPVIALTYGYMGYANSQYQDAAKKGMTWLQNHMTPDGRMLTSYEISHTEAWRPPSSDTAIALKAASIAARILREYPLWHTMSTLAKALLSWQDQSGAIRNCDNDTTTASKQNNTNVTDLVYTDGNALMGLIEAHRTNGDSKYRVAAERLATFLAGIQCRGESEHWDGSWRGSYHLIRKQWYGRANQRNELDEGGMFSAYTGYSTAEIAYGMVMLLPNKK